MPRMPALARCLSVPVRTGSSPWPGLVRGGRGEEELTDVGVTLTDGPFQVGDYVRYARGGNAVVEVEADGR